MSLAVPSGMLTWAEISADARRHFVAVKHAHDRIHVQTERMCTWVMMQPTVLAQGAVVVVMVTIGGAETSADPFVRVVLPVERLDWQGLREACENAAGMARALAPSGPIELALKAK
jgi:hypothetical protein